MFEKTFHLTVKSRNLDTTQYSGQRLVDQTDALEDQERAIVFLMPVGTQYTDTDGDTWERIE